MDLPPAKITQKALSPKALKETHLRLPQYSTENPKDKSLSQKISDEDPSFAPQSERGKTEGSGDPNNFDEGSFDHYGLGAPNTADLVTRPCRTQNKTAQGTR